MVVQLQDLVRRRMPLVLMMPPNEAVLEDLSELVGQELGWDAAERRRQVQRSLARWPRIVSDDSVDPLTGIPRAASTA